jgi:hypothetical protein
VVRRQCEGAHLSRSVERHLTTPRSSSGVHLQQGQPDRNGFRTPPSPLIDQSEGDCRVDLDEDVRQRVGQCGHTLVPLRRPVVQEPLGDPFQLGGLQGGLDGWRQPGCNAEFVEIHYDPT